MFTVHEKRVVVVGAARSGVAAAELLARRGARVTLTESREVFAESDRMRAAGVEAFLVGEAFMRADEPGPELSTLFRP